MAKPRHMSGLTYGLAKILGAIDEDAAAGAVTTTDSIMGYVKQLVTAIVHATYGLSAIKTLIDTVDTVVDAIKAVTDNLPDSGALTTIDGYFDVPTKDTTDDAQMRDATGKKDDTAVTAVGTTKSIMAYVKGAISLLVNGTYGLNALKSLVDTVDGYHDVPTADSTDNAQMRDLTGNKSDAAQTTVGTTRSIMAYVKGVLNQLASATYGLSALKTLIDTLDTVADAIKAKTDNLPSDPADASDVAALIAVVDGYHDVPSADTTDNNHMRDSAGNKTDAAVIAVGTTKSIMAYVKGAITLLIDGTYGLSALKAILDTSGVMVNDLTTAYSRKAGRCQIFEKAITAAANAGSTTVATITTQSCIIESIILFSNSASQTDLTSAAIEGGASSVIEFISATDAAVANIDAVDEQVWWTGAVLLQAGDTITIDLQGTGATTVDLKVEIKFRAVANGGYLA